MAKFTMIYGEGRGKTTLAMGYIYQNKIMKKTITVAQFLKTGKDCGECSYLRDRADVRWFCFGKDSFFTSEKQKEEYVAIISEGIQALHNSLEDNHTDFLLLDELGMALSFELVSWEKIIVLSNFVRKEVIVTGRRIPLEIRETANKLIEIKEKKHPYNKGIGARVGIEF